MFHFRELLHTKRRQVDTCERLNAVLGDSCLSCELQLAGPEYEGFQQGFSCLPPSVAEELFSSNLSDDESFLQALTPELTQLKKTKVSFDNSLSPAHTLLKIHCVDQKSLLYDITRTLKDFNIKVGSSCFILYSSFSLFIYFFVLVFLRLNWTVLQFLRIRLLPSLLTHLHAGKVASCASSMCVQSKLSILIH